MPHFQPNRSYTYADIGLHPNRLSEIKSRGECNTQVDFLNLTLKMPIVAAPMETITGAELAKRIEELGGIAVLPRTSDDDADIDLLEISYVKSDTAPPPFRSIVSIGAKPGYMERFKRFYDLGIRRFCIDVANGYNQKIGDQIAKLKDEEGDIFIIAGNVASVQGFQYLADRGADAIRVGIGGGSVCTTSVATGVGVGQASIVRDISKWKLLRPEEDSALLIADGGIKEPGDVAKAIALGADVVMVGGILGGTEESEGRVVKFNGQLYKQIAGQASRIVKGEKRNIEGAEVLVPYSGEVQGIWETYKDGLQSAMSYMNCMDLNEFRHLDDTCFVHLTDAAKSERRVHAS